MSHRTVSAIGCIESLVHEIHETSVTCAKVVCNGFYRALVEPSNLDRFHFEVPDGLAPSWSSPVKWDTKSISPVLDNYRRKELSRIRQESSPLLRPRVQGRIITIACYAKSGSVALALLSIGPTRIIMEVMKFLPRD